MAAILAYAPKELPQTCQRCRSDDEPDLRKQWGCDAPQSDPVQWIGCGECDGHDTSCRHCNGTGLLALHRCPWAMMDESPQCFEVVQYANLIEAGILPVAGGLREQSAVFVDGLKHVLRNKAQIEKELRERQKQ